MLTPYLCGWGSSQQESTRPVDKDEVHAPRSKQSSAAGSRARNVYFRIADGDGQETPPPRPEERCSYESRAATRPKEKETQHGGKRRRTDELRLTKFENFASWPNGPRQRFDAVVASTSTYWPCKAFPSRDFTPYAEACMGQQWLGEEDTRHQSVTRRPSRHETLFSNNSHRRQRSAMSATSSTCLSHNTCPSRDFNPNAEACHVTKQRDDGVDDVQTASRSGLSLAFVLRLLQNSSPTVSRCNSNKQSLPTHYRMPFPRFYPYCGGVTCGVATLCMFVCAL